MDSFPIEIHMPVGDVELTIDGTNPNGTKLYISQTFLRAETIRHIDIKVKPGSQVRCQLNTGQSLTFKAQDPLPPTIPGGLNAKLK